jgi:pterin-4a-carbinolamine dehydratase
MAKLSVEQMKNNLSQLTGWSILMFGWNKVKITISTHSEGGVTEKDFQLAKKTEERLK